MGRITEMDNRFLDKTILPKVIEGYGSIRKFAIVADIPYHVAKRVLNNQPCRTDEIDLVTTAWKRLDPQQLRDLINGGRKNFKPIAAALMDILDGLQQT